MSSFILIVIMYECFIEFGTIYAIRELFMLSVISPIKYGDYEGGCCSRLSDKNNWEIDFQECHQIESTISCMG